MWKKTVIAVALAGTAAIATPIWAAADAAPAIAGTPAAAVQTMARTAGRVSDPPAVHKHHAKAERALRGALHGQWVTKDHKTGAFVTHDIIRGAASAVSTTSITVTAADTTKQTYVVTPTTKIHVNALVDGKRTHKLGTASDIKGDVIVVGTGAGTLASPLTATQIVVPAPKK